MNTKVVDEIGRERMSAQNTFLLPTMAERSWKYFPGTREEEKRGTRRRHSPDPSNNTVTTTTYAAKAEPTRSIKKTKLDDTYTVASTTLPPPPTKPLYERTIPSQNLFDGMSGAVMEHLRVIRNADATINPDFDQFIHELDATSNHLKTLSRRRAEQGVQTSPVEALPTLRTPKPSRPIHKLPSSTSQSSLPPEQEILCSCCCGENPASQSPPTTGQHQAQSRHHAQPCISPKPPSRLETLRHRHSQLCLQAAPHSRTPECHERHHGMHQRSDRRGKVYQQRQSGGLNCPRQRCQRTHFASPVAPDV